MQLPTELISIVCDYSEGIVEWHGVVKTLSRLDDDAANVRIYQPLARMRTRALVRAEYGLGAPFWRALAGSDGEVTGSAVVRAVLGPSQCCTWGADSDLDIVVPYSCTHRPIADYLWALRDNAAEPEPETQHEKLVYGRKRGWSHDIYSHLEKAGISQVDTYAVGGKPIQVMYLRATSADGEPIQPMYRQARPAGEYAKVDAIAARRWIETSFDFHFVINGVNKDRAWIGHPLSLVHKTSPLLWSGLHESAEGRWINPADQPVLDWSEGPLVLGHSCGAAPPYRCFKWHTRGFTISNVVLPRVIKLPVYERGHGTGHGLSRSAAAKVLVQRLAKLLKAHNWPCKLEFCPPLDRCAERVELLCQTGDIEEN